MPDPLSAHGLSRSFGARPVLTGLDLVAPPGRVLVVVGENGTGKSTLLRLLAGRDEPDAGHVMGPADLGYLAQDLEAPDAWTVGDLLDNALAPLHRLVARVEELAVRLGDPQASEEYAAVLDEAVLRDAWDAGRRAAEAAARLGLGDLDPARPLGTLSGGQRSRLALAALLVRRPAGLLLDEPTNHLDDDGAAYLVEQLREHPGAVVVATHDRAFIEEVADLVLDLDPSHFGSDGRGGRLHGVDRRAGTGGYTDLLARKAAARARWEQAHAEREDELGALRRAAVTTARQVAPGRGPRDNDRFIHHAKGEHVARTVSRRVRDTGRRLAALEADPIRRPPAPLEFTGTLAPGSGASVQVRDLEVPGRLRLGRLDVAPGSRLLVTGANGSGKSTLLRLLAGEVPEGTSGSVTVHARRVGHLPQDVRFRTPGRTARALYDALVPDGPPLHDLGLLHPRSLTQPVGVLSQGQQRRLALAVLVARRPDLVLLDEPTHHLSLTLAEELEEALGRSPGTVVLASHDRWLRSRWSDDVLTLGDA